MSRLAAIFAAALLAGCATTSRPVSNDRTRAAMAYAERVIGRSAPVRVEWRTFPAQYERDGIWYHTGAAGRSQFFNDRTRIVVYVGPEGQQDQRVYNHEAGHAVLREPRHDPKWKRYFLNWVDQ
jgi:hypothetical protein